MTYTTPKNNLNSKESCVSQLKIQAHQSYTECNPEFTNRKNETYFMSNVPQISLYLVQRGLRDVSYDDCV